MITPELVLRAVVAQGLELARQSEGLIPTIFKQRDTVDAGTDPATGEPNADSYYSSSKRFMRWMDEYERIAVNLNYPRNNLKRPLISIVTGARREHTERHLQTFGPVGITEVMSIPSQNADIGWDMGDGTNAIASVEEIGSLMGAKYQVIVETHDPVITNLLSELVFWILFFAKMRLEHDWGIMNAVMGISDFHLDERFSPPDVSSRVVSFEASVVTSISGKAFIDSEDNAHYWDTIHPCITTFIVRLMDGTQVMLLDQATQGSVVI